MEAAAISSANFRRAACSTSVGRPRDRGERMTVEVSEEVEVEVEGVAAEKN